MAAAKVVLEAGEIAIIPVRIMFLVIHQVIVLTVVISQPSRIMVLTIVES